MDMPPDPALIMKFIMLIVKRMLIFTITKGKERHLYGSIIVKIKLSSN